MEFWFSGEIDAVVDEGGRYRAAIADIERALSSGLGTHDYGVVREWAMVPIIMDPNVGGFNEVKRYNRKRRELEFRLRIDLAKFVATDDRGKRTLLIDLIIRSIALARGMGIGEFNFDRFEGDLRAIAAGEGWVL